MTKRYTQQQAIHAIENSRSIHQVLHKLGLRKCGGNYDTIKRLISKLNLDVEHFEGQNWLAGKHTKDWTEYKRPAAVRKRLIQIRGVKCECCNLAEWMGQPITIELHHIDGDKSNHSFENLQLLCPNCHSLTDNWRYKKRASGEIGSTRQA